MRPQTLPLHTTVSRSTVSGNSSSLCHWTLLKFGRTTMPSLEGRLAVKITLSLLIAPSLLCTKIICCGKWIEGEEVRCLELKHWVMKDTEKYLCWHYETGYERIVSTELNNEVLAPLLFTLFCFILDSYCTSWLKHADMNQIACLFANLKAI